MCEFVCVCLCLFVCVLCDNIQLADKNVSHKMESSVQSPITSYWASADNINFLGEMQRVVFLPTTIIRMCSCICFRVCVCMCLYLVGGPEGNGLRLIRYFLTVLQVTKSYPTTYRSRFESRSFRCRLKLINHHQTMTDRTNMLANK